jgi:hypothetical protein
LTQLRDRFLGQRIEPAGINVLFELAVPSGGIELREPRAKVSQFLRRQLLDCPLNLGDGTHDLIVVLANGQMKLIIGAQSSSPWNLQDALEMAVRSLPRQLRRASRRKVA